VWARCITNEYMANSAVMTVRIQPALLVALKARARSFGRSTSAEVLQLIRAHVTAEPEPAACKPTMGMFSQFDAPDLAEFALASTKIQKQFTYAQGAKASGARPERRAK
jgi:plasmid stability protein